MHSTTARTARSISLGALAAALAAPAHALPTVPEGSPIGEALERANAAITAIVAVPAEKRDFANTVGAIDDLIARLELDSNMTMFMQYVSPDADERAKGKKAEEDWQAWLIEFGKDEDLYRAVKEYSDTNPALDPGQKRLLEHTLRDYRRAGMSLPPNLRTKLTEIEKELSQLSIAFEENIREDATKLFLSDRELAGMPEDYLSSLERTGDLYMVGMSYPEFVPIQDLCDVEETRHKTWLAYKRRGGEKNVDVLQKILAKRAEAANLLGYDHPADFEIEVRMAKDADTVMAFYGRLRPLVRKKALIDYDELVTAKRAKTANRRAELYPWDASYYQEIVRKEKYAVDSEKVREYFPIERVVDGLFSITQSLYGLEYRDVTAGARTAGEPLWHEDVSKYEVWDRATQQMLGVFYVDLHPRDNKYNHAAQWGLAQHKVWADGTVTKPIAALVCNFTKPTSDKPSLLTHDEVETFFHEFGHCLHTILSESRFWRFSGTGVERDFVEAPSQMFENWVWDADVLETFARHYETGEPFPTQLLDGMIRARHLGSGMLAERQFFYGIFDMTCHVDPEGDVDTTQLAHDLWGGGGSGVELYAPVPETFFHASFGHLTGYQAGYYGYQWSLVYACDMFQRFKELGMLDPKAGMYYRKKILARGGTTDGIELVKDYLGREPDMRAYLEHLGLNEKE
jgi:thimet oligopeptidase